jgi:hypothetical protein
MRRSDRHSHQWRRAPRAQRRAQLTRLKSLDVLDPRSPSSSPMKRSRMWPCASTARPTRSSRSGRRIGTRCRARIRPSHPGCSCARPESDELRDVLEINDQGRARGHTNATPQTGLAVPRTRVGQRPSLSRRAVSLVSAYCCDRAKSADPCVSFRPAGRTTSANTAQSRRANWTKARSSRHGVRKKNEKLSGTLPQVDIRVVIVASCCHHWSCACRLDVGCFFVGRTTDRAWVCACRLNSRNSF